MNSKEQSQITELIATLDKHNIKLHNKIEAILSTLEDDPTSNNIGLKTRVNDLTEEVKQLTAMSKNLKRLGGFVATISTLLAGFFLNKYK
jgi:type II secretory pathway predicted ATPase ExeA